jgi:hypothetical protein
MNLEFAERVRKKGAHVGLAIGFSIQPLIERRPDGSLHPAIYGAAANFCKVLMSLNFAIAPSRRRNG